MMIGWTLVRAAYQQGYDKAESHIQALEAENGRLGKEIASLRAEIGRVRPALVRQTENMAFILNHGDLSAQWYDKLGRELEEDRAALQERPKDRED